MDPEATKARGLTRVDLSKVERRGFIVSREMKRKRERERKEGVSTVETGLFIVTFFLVCECF